VCVCSNVFTSVYLICRVLLPACDFAICCTGRYKSHCLSAAVAGGSRSSDSDDSSDDDEDGLGAAGTVDVVTESDDEESAELLEKKLLEDAASGPAQVRVQTRSTAIHRLTVA